MDHGAFPGFWGAGGRFPGKGAESSRHWDQCRVHPQKRGQFPFLVPGILSGELRQAERLPGVCCSPPSGPAASPPAVLGRDGAQSVLRARHPHPRGAQQAENTPRQKGDFLLIWVFLLVKNIPMKREFLLIWVAVLLMTVGEPAAGAWQDPD